MTYSDFVANFEDSRLAGPAVDLDKSPNHKVNAIRGDEYGMSAIEVESKLRNKLRESFEVGFQVLFFDRPIYQKSINGNIVRN